MKKHLLIGVAVSIASVAVAQNTPSAKVTLQKINPVVARQTAKVPKQLSGTNDSFESMVNAIGPQSQLKNTNRTSLPYTVIGTTQYQLQTNASICNRIVKSADETISATWTMSQTSNWAERGTGYNYFDGTSWGAMPTVRIEDERTGFTNIGITTSGKEIVISHEAPLTGNSDDLHISSRPAKGTGAWTQGGLGTPDTWSRLAVGGANGETLHVIAQTSGANTPIVPFHGQDGAVVYSRSLDGGATWDKLRTVIPQIDSSFYLGFGGDAYSIDAKGDTVAIVLGGFSVDVVLLKSTDNGNSWTKTIVDSFPIAMYTSDSMTTDVGNDGIIDTVETNDGSVTVLLDNSGNAHVWYGRMRVLCDNPGTSAGQGLSYFPTTNGIMYWNESMGATPPNIITGVLDLNGDGELNIDYDPDGAAWGFGSYNLSLTSMPSAGIDAGGNLYLTYSGLYEGINDAGTVGGASTSNPGKSFRHQYLMRSLDNGANWESPVDLTAPTSTGDFDYLEGVYGAIAKDVDEFVHIIVQQDQSAGHGVSEDSPDTQNGPAEIVYYRLPFDAIETVGIKENKAALSSVNVYPNPASGSVNVMFNLDKAEKATVTVTNMVGQEISTFEENLNAGTSTLNINLNSYKSGIYFIKTTVGGKVATKKLVVE
jgi:hypothetical protein